MHFRSRYVARGPQTIGIALDWSSDIISSVVRQEERNFRNLVHQLRLMALKCTEICTHRRDTTLSENTHSSTAI